MKVVINRATRDVVYRSEPEFAPGMGITNACIIYGLNPDALEEIEITPEMLVEETQTREVVKSKNNRRKKIEQDIVAASTSTLTQAEKTNLLFELKQMELSK